MSALAMRPGLHATPHILGVGYGLNMPNIPAKLVMAEMV
jgi:hypothetical protein